MLKWSQNTVVRLAMIIVLSFTVQIQFSEFSQKASRQQTIGNYIQYIMSLGQVHVSTNSERNERGNCFTNYFATTHKFCIVLIKLENTREHNLVVKFGSLSENSRQNMSQGHIAEPFMGRYCIYILLRKCVINIPGHTCSPLI